MPRQIFDWFFSRLPQWDSLTWVLVLLVGLIVIRVTATYACGEGAEKKSLLELVDSGLIALVLVFFIIRPFIVQAFYIPSGSMEPTLYGSDRGGDRILVCKWIYRFREPRRKEIVVFSAPPEADDAVRQGNNKDFIKRLIGLPGDVVEVKDGFVYVNGVKQEEPYINQRPAYEMKIVAGKVYSSDHNWSPGNDPHVDNRPSERIPEGRYLVMGDNRNNSNDSHKWGLLDKSRILGRAMFVFWGWPPLNRIGLLDGTSGPVVVAQDTPVNQPSLSPAYAD